MDPNYPFGAMAGTLSHEARSLVRIAFLTSGAVVALVLYVLCLQPPAATYPAWTTALPAMNAGFNALTLALLSLAVLAIRRGRIGVHVSFHIGALASGVLFLAGYVIHHHFHGDTAVPGTGWIRPVSFFVLISHIPSATVALPLVVTSALFAATRWFSQDRRWARVTVPVWLYASLTGLVVYFLLTGAS